MSQYKGNLIATSALVSERRFQPRFVGIDVRHANNALLDGGGDAKELRVRNIRLRD